MTKNSTQRRFTSEQCLDAVRYYEATLQPGEIASEPSYNRWQHDRPEIAPTSQTLKVRFGSWNNARLLASTTPEEVNMNIGGMPRRITSEICDDALRRYAEEHPGEKIKYAKYEQWQRERTNTPSGRTIRRAAPGKSWQEIVKQVLSEDERTR